MIDDVRLPIPWGRASLKGAQEDITIMVLRLSRTTSIEVRQVHDHGRIGNASGVHAKEELEAEVFSSGVHDIEVVLEIRPGGSPATVVDSESVDAGVLREDHVSGVIEIGRLIGDHVVGEDHWRSGGSAFYIPMLMIGIVMRGTSPQCHQCRNEEAIEGRHR